MGHYQRVRLHSIGHEMPLVCFQVSHQWSETVFLTEKSQSWMDFGLIISFSSLWTFFNFEKLFLFCDSIVSTSISCLCLYLMPGLCRSLTHLHSSALRHRFNTEGSSYDHRRGKGVGEDTQDWGVRRWKQKCLRKVRLKKVRLNLNRGLLSDFIKWQVDQSLLKSVRSQNCGVWNRARVVKETMRSTWQLECTQLSWFIQLERWLVKFSLEMSHWGNVFIEKIFEAREWRRSPKERVWSVKWADVLTLKKAREGGRISQETWKTPTAQERTPVSK